MVIVTLLECLGGIFLVGLYTLILLSLSPYPNEVIHELRLTVSWNLGCTMIWLISTMITLFYLCSLIQTLHCLYQNRQTNHWLTTQIRMITKVAKHPTILEHDKQNLDLVDGFYDAMSMAEYLLRQQQYLLRSEIHSTLNMNDMFVTRFQNWYKTVSQRCTNISKQHGYDLGLCSILQIMYGK